MCHPSSTRFLQVVTLYHFLKELPEKTDPSPPHRHESGTRCHGTLTGSPYKTTEVTKQCAVVVVVVVVVLVVVVLIAVVFVVVVVRVQFNLALQAVCRQLLFPSTA